MSGGRRKRRITPHIMEDESIDVLKNSLPRPWVVRKYRPDYGLDVAVEAFVEVAEGAGSFETLGEHFFAQVKSKKKVTTKTITVVPRMNVARFPGIVPVPGGEDDARQIEIIPYRIDTNLLVTVQAMGASAPVFLFLVSLEDKRVFFLCLNDYIDKILIPETPNFADSDHVVLRIPARNEIGRGEGFEEGTISVTFFAKRAKFYSAFNVFAYQLHELGYAVGLVQRRQMAAYFIQSLKRLDVWDDVPWPIVNVYGAWLKHLEKALPNIPGLAWFESHPGKKFVTEFIEGENRREMLLDMDIQNFWSGLNVLGRQYEEINREWCLPTHLAEVFRS